MTILDRITGAAASDPARARARASARLSARRTLAFAGLNLLVLWAMVTAFLWTTYRHDLENWKRIALTTSLTTAAYTKQVLSTSDLVLRSLQDWVAEMQISSDEDFRRVMSQRGFNDALRDRILGSPHIAIAAIADRNGIVVNTTSDYPARLIDISDREQFALQSVPNPPAITLTGVAHSRSRGRLTFFISRKITSMSGAFLGVAIVGIDVENISEFFRQAAVGGEDSISLFRTDGTLLASTLDKPSLLGLRFDRAVPLQLVQHGRSGTVELVNGPRWSDQNDIATRLMAPRLVEGYPVFISVSIGQNVYLGNWAGKSLFILAAALVLSAIIVYIAFRFLDLAERTRKADRIANERRMLATLVDTPTALCAVLDRQGRMLYCNERFAGMLATTRENPATALSDPALAGADKVVEFATEGTEAAIELDLRLERSGEPIRYLHFSVSRQTLPDLGSCTIMVGHDETARHQLQLAMAQSAKMLTLGELTTGMAHELSQPLNVIRMAAQNALTETAPNADDTAIADMPPMTDQEFRSFAATKLSRIMAQVDRAADILSRMRIFGRAPSGPPQIFDARDAIRSALGLVGPRIRGMGITIREALGEQELPLSGHQNQLEQVLVNLLMNARDALAGLPRPDKLIDVSAALGPQGRVLMQVADNGPGVPEEIRERIFEPFFTAKPLGQGTGLGLALAFGIVRDAGGMLSLLPDTAGATFQIDLPRVMPAVVA